MHGQENSPAGDRLNEFGAKNATGQAVEIEIRAEVRVHQGAKHAEDEDEEGIVSSEMRIFGNDVFK